MDYVIHTANLHIKLQQEKRGTTMNKNYEKLLTEEIESKITEMESQSYEFPERFSKKDYILTAVVILVCLLGVICGAFIA